MATLTFPTITPESFKFGATYNTQISNSGVSGVTQTVEMPGARWRGSMSFTDMTSTESAALKAFLMQLRGSAGRFYYGDISHPNPFNVVTGSPTILGGSTAREINITLAASSPPLSVGDYVQIGTDSSRELKMIINTVDNGSDNYDLTLEPMIRRTDYATKPVVYSIPKGTFMLASDDQASWGIRSKALLSDINLDFIEIFV